MQNIVMRGTGFAQKLTGLTEKERRKRLQTLNAALCRVKRGTLSRDGYLALKCRVDESYAIPAIQIKTAKIGDVFGELTLVGFSRNRFGQTEGMCQCACGNHSTTNIAKLNSGYTKSCGCLREKKRKPDLTLRRIFTYYKATAKKKCIPFSLKFEAFKLLVLSPCVYCNSLGVAITRGTKTGSFTETIVKTGIDRRNNLAGYTVENCASCCSRCNYAKGSMPLSEFMGWALRFAGTNPSINTRLAWDRQAAQQAYGTYRYLARKKRQVFELTLAQFVNLITKPCYYCETQPYRIWRTGLYFFTCNGIDRRVNSNGYSVRNSVPCCPHCNYAKRQMTELEFRAWAKQLGNNLKQKITNCEPIGSLN